MVAKYLLSDITLKVKRIYGDLGAARTLLSNDQKLQIR